MRCVKLVPLHGKARNKLHNADFPAEWVVRETKDMVAFSDREGPWLHVYPDNNKSDSHSRWVHQHNDTDFRVVES